MKLLSQIIVAILFCFLLLTCGDKNVIDEVTCEPSSPIANFSFEIGEHRVGAIPDGWINCGDSLNAPSDLFRNNQPNPFEVINLAKDGLQYIGMAARLDGSRECISQILEAPLFPGSYQVLTSIARSDSYNSWITIDGNVIEVFYNSPVTLDVIAVNNNNEERLLLSTIPNDSLEWIEVIENIEVTTSIREIKLSPNFIGEEFYSGGLLIDYFQIVRR